MPTSLVSTGIQFPDSTIQTTAATSTVTLLANSAGPYYPSTNYTWTITNYDSYTTYTLTTTNGSVSRVVETITYSASSSGAGGYTINGRAINLTISPSPFFMSIIVNSVTNTIPYGIGVDSSANVYSMLQTQAASASYAGFEFMKVDSTNTISFQKNLAPTSTSPAYLTQGKTDSSNNLIATGYSQAFNGSGYNDLILVKYNSSGTLQFQKRVDTSNTNDAGQSICADSSGNIYVCGYTQIYSFQWQLIAKFDSSGAGQWVIYRGGSGSIYGIGVAVDSSGNVYSSAYQNNGGWYGDFSKHNSSGTLQWQSRIDTSSFGSDAAVDSSGNAIFLGYYGNNPLLIKYDSSGTVLWKREFAIAVGSIYPNRVTVDSSDNIYYVGQFNNGIFIAKYNSAGTLQWQRTVTTANVGGVYGRNITVDSASGLVYVSGYAGTGGVFTYEAVFTMCVPVDGSKTGTYSLYGTTFTYAASSQTEQASTKGVSAQGLASYGTGYTVYTTTMTEYSTSLTSTKTTL